MRQNEIFSERIAVTCDRLTRESKGSSDEGVPISVVKGMSEQYVLTFNAFDDDMDLVDVVNPHIDV